MLILRTATRVAWRRAAVIYALAPFVFGVAPGALADQPRATLTIKVERVSPAGGDVRVGLYDAGTYDDDNSDSLAGAVTTAQSPETVIELSDIAPGAYALKLFQDINRNGKMDFTWIGLPEEPFGFSRDARPLLGKPSYNKVKFNLLPGANMLTVRLQTLP